MTFEECDMTLKGWLRCAIVPAALCGLLTPSVSQAAITFTQSPVSTTVNVGDYNYTSDPKVVQGLNLNANNGLGQNTPILTVAADQNLTINGQGGGQAYLSSTQAIGSIVVTPITPPLSGFSVIEFNPLDTQKPNTNQEVTMTLTAFYNNNQSSTSGSFTFSVNGENRVAAVATGGDVISKLMVTFNPAAPDALKQFRIDGALATPPPPTNPAPEPSTVVLALTGFAGLGLARGVRRLRHREEVAQ